MQQRIITSWQQSLAIVLGLVLFCGILAPPALAAGKGSGEMVTMMHYFSGELGRKGLNTIIKSFQEQNQIVVFDNPIGHADFKTTILSMAAAGNLPDIFSYWAGTRTQFIADSGELQPIDDIWAKNNLGAMVPKSIADGATMYNGKRYLIPFGYHYTGIFYNPELIAKLKPKVKWLPKNWKEFISLCQKLKRAGVTPIALGSKNRWPAQFWFDYLILRTAGPEYRARLMSGQASYTDPEVVQAMELWKAMVDKGFFTKFANADTWTDAADKVADGEAAMTLMGTWITGYWNGKGRQPLSDYDFFEFPEIEKGVPKASVGPLDGLLLSKEAPNAEAARKLITFMISDVDSQTTWAKAQGALSPNKSVSADIYTPVMKKALEVVNGSDTFAFNYDLATTPPMAEVGLSMFSQFMDDPSKFQEYLQTAQNSAEGIFK